MGLNKSLCDNIIAINERSREIFFQAQKILKRIDAKLFISILNVHIYTLYPFVLLYDNLRYSGISYKYIVKCFDYEMIVKREDKTKSKYSRKCITLLNNHII